MVQRVLPNAQVAQAWAKQSQPEGRSGNGNLWFDGDTIYSYGRHFPAGRIVTAADGRKVALVNSDTYSTTTANHLGKVYMAAYHQGLPIFRVPGCSTDHAANVAHFEHLAHLAAVKARDPRRRQARQRYLDEERRAHTEAERYRATFCPEALPHAA